MSQERLPTRPADERLPVPQENTNFVISALKELIRQAQLAWRLFFDPRVPWITKIIPPAALIYILSPIDIIPDLSLGLGQLDDLAVLLLGIKLFIELAPAEVVREHLIALGAKISEWTAREEEPPVIEGEVVKEEGEVIEEEGEE
jgi:uncharacterized membrane protein YkvA (DUF1232 family)